MALYVYLFPYLQVLSNNMNICKCISFNNLIVSLMESVPAGMPSAEQGITNKHHFHPMQWITLFKERTNILSAIKSLVQTWCHSYYNTEVWYHIAPVIHFQFSNPCKCYPLLFPDLSPSPSTSSSQFSSYARLVDPLPFQFKRSPESIVPLARGWQAIGIWRFSNGKRRDKIVHRLLYW